MFCVNWIIRVNNKLFVLEISRLIVILVLFSVCCNEVKGGCISLYCVFLVVFELFFKLNILWVDLREWCLYLKISGKSE